MRRYVCWYFRGRARGAPSPITFHNARVQLNWWRAEGAPTARHATQTRHTAPSTLQRLRDDGSRSHRRFLVGAAGFEPTTPSPPDWCANQAALRSEGAPFAPTRPVGQSRIRRPEGSAGRSCATPHFNLELFPLGRACTRGRRIQPLRRACTCSKTSAKPPAPKSTKRASQGAHQRPAIRSAGRQPREPNGGR